MADKDIRQKIVLDGEKEYNAALQSAQRNLKVLRSELKAETAELGKNATEQQKNETRLKNLQKQIKEQEKVVKTYEQALQEVREKYGDNEDAIAKWEVKLNTARTALANMKSGLDDVGGGLKQTAADINTGVTASKSLADSFQKMGEVAGSISAGIESAFTAVVDRISQAVQAIWGELMDIAAKSDNYMDLAAYFGSSATEVQKWDNAMKGAGGSLDTVTSLITKLKYGGKDAKIAEWFGIAPEGFDNDLAFFQQIMQQMFDMRDSMKEAGTWDQAMVDIFGNKKGMDVEGVLSDWEEIQNGLEMFDADKGGYGLSEEEIQKMADLNVQVETLKTSWKTLQEMATVHLFGDLALNITGNLQNIVDAFKEYFEAEDDAGRQAALEKVKQNIIEIFTQIKTAIEEGLKILGEVAAELKNSEDPTIKLMGEILDKLVSALKWFTDDGNIEKVKKGFETLIGIWAMGKFGSAFGNLASFAANIATIKGAGLFGGAGAAGAGGAAAGGGFGSLLAGAGYLAVGLMMVAPSVQKLFDPKTWQSSETEQALDEAREEDPEGIAVLVDEGKKSGKIDNRDILRGAWNRATYTGGDPSGMSLSKEKQEELPENPWLGDITIPRAAKKLDVTPEQRAAAEAFWDAWKIGGSVEGGLDTMDSAWENLEKVFEGNGGTLDRLDDLMTKLYEEIDSNGGSMTDSRWEDLPASWWTNPGGGENELTSEDLSGFRSVPGLMLKAVQSGVSGIKVTLDGYAVGQLVAPYVSNEIAMGI